MEVNGQQVTLSDGASIDLGGKSPQLHNRLDAMFSVGNEDSDVTKINENGSGEVSEETAFIMNRAMQVSKETKGAFDITIYPVMTALSAVLNIPR